MKWDSCPNEWIPPCVAVWRKDLEEASDGSRLLAAELSHASCHWVWPGGPYIWCRENDRFPVEIFEETPIQYESLAKKNFFAYQMVHCCENQLTSFGEAYHCPSHFPQVGTRIGLGVLGRHPQRAPSPACCPTFRPVDLTGEGCFCHLQVKMDETSPGLLCGMSWNVFFLLIIVKLRTYMCLKNHGIHPKIFSGLESRKSACKDFPPWTDWARCPVGKGWVL